MIDQLAAADVLARAGQTVSAVDQLTAANREDPDPRVQRRLVELRHAAFAELSRDPGLASWPPALADPFPDEDGVPAIDPDSLSGPGLGGAILHHGCVRVDGLFAPFVDRFRTHIDRAFDARERTRPLTPTTIETPPTFPSSSVRPRPRGFGSRGFVRTVDAPAALADLVDAFADTGITRAVTDYLGERPAMIANKWILRR